jgi:hypothetical protein
LAELFRKNKNKALLVLTGLDQCVLKLLNRFLTIGDDTVDDAISFNFFAFDRPIYIGRDLIFFDKFKREVSGHFSAVIIARRVNITIKVGGVQYVFD